MIRGTLIFPTEPNMKKMGKKAKDQLFYRNYKVVAVFQEKYKFLAK